MSPRALRQHWPEYLIEGTGLAIFMVSAGLCATLLEYPESPVRLAIDAPVFRRLLMGVAMGMTAIAIIYSPWGKQSGAHINPAITLTFFRLGKIERWDALFYVGFQFLGAVSGVLLVAVVIGSPFTDTPVSYLVTRPGSGRAAVAFLVELSISFLLMTVVLVTTNTRGLDRYTGIFAGVLVATYVTLVVPTSGMSMNPARTFGSAFPSGIWTALWLYFTAPPLGMLLAAQGYLWLSGPRTVACAKLHHRNDKRCIFRCGYRPGPARAVDAEVDRRSPER
jgi:aquaporin Z